MTKNEFAIPVDTFKGESEAERLETAKAYIANNPGCELKDGEVRVVDPETGGAKGRKPERYGLIPIDALAEVARVYGYGAEKYEPNNWRKGYAWSLSYDALQRHVNAFWNGESRDPESGLLHLAHAAFHLFSLMTYEGVEDYSGPVFPSDLQQTYWDKDDRPR